MVTVRRELYSMNKTRVIANGFVILKRYAVIEYNRHIVRSRDGTERALLSDTDAIDHLGMAGNLAHRREGIKSKCVPKALIDGRPVSFPSLASSLLSIAYFFLRYSPFFSFAHSNQPFAFGIPGNIRYLARYRTNFVL